MLFTEHPFLDRFEHAARAGFGIRARHRFADAARGSGNDTDLAFDVHVTSHLF